MWEMKEDEYTKSLAKNHVWAKFNMQEVLKKKCFINVSCPFEGHKHGLHQKPVETICHMCKFIASLEEIKTRSY